jgi:hypothetical protein
MSIFDYSDLLIQIFSHFSSRKHLKLLLEVSKESNVITKQNAKVLNLRIAEDLLQVYQQFYNVQILSIQLHKISDVTPLLELPKLKVLSCSGFKLDAKIELLTNLKELYINNYKQLQLEQIVQLTNLKKIKLGNNPLLNITKLNTLTNLNEITVYNIGINIDVSLLPKLKLLNLVRSRILNLNNLMFNNYNTLVNLNISYSYKPITIVELPKSIMYLTLWNIKVPNNSIDYLYELNDLRHLKLKYMNVKINNKDLLKINATKITDGIFSCHNAVSFKRCYPYINVMYCDSVGGTFYPLHVIAI